MKLLVSTLFALAYIAPLAHAKLPPMSPEAQVKADEAKLKTAWSDKVAAYQLCRSMDKVAESYFKTAKSAGKETKPPVATPPCTDPGPFAAAAAPAASKPLEASGAHSPAAAATSPPGSKATQAQLQGTTKK